MPFECFVYITLPGQIEPVTAGRYRLDVNQQGMAVGQFVYGKSYLARAERLEFDPVELKLRTLTYRSARLGGGFGALRDGTPDAWGRKLIKKCLGDPTPSELDYLIASPDDRAGALGFGFSEKPPAPLSKFNGTLDLQKLIEVADQIVETETDPDATAPLDSGAQHLELLLQAGTSMGGARPKVTVEDNGALWVAKFERKDDKWSNPRVEHAMLALARNCGVSTAESRIESIGTRDIILVKRFDRHRLDEGYSRSRMVSALTMLNADESPSGRDKWSYLLLADEIRRASGSPDRDLPELFRRIAFNALISNTDDHPRNHAMIAKETAWRLSPAYDLTPTPMVAQKQRNLAMAFGRYGRYANRTNLLSESARYRVSNEEAVTIVDAMTETVRNTWYGVCRQAGVNERDCGLIRSAFINSGFFIDLAVDQPGRSQ